MHLINLFAVVINYDDAHILDRAAALSQSVVLLRAAHKLAFVIVNFPVPRISSSESVELLSQNVRLGSAEDPGNLFSKERGSFDPMVDQRLKSLVFERLAMARIIEIFALSTIVCRPLPFLHLLCCLFWTQISEAVI